MQVTSIVRRIRCNTTKELRELLEDYTGEVPLQTGLTRGIEVQVHQNTQDPSELSLVIEELENSQIKITLPHLNGQEKT